MCCQNNYVVKSSDQDLEVYKKEKKRQGKLSTEHESEEENKKYKRNKEFLDKHMKDSSFKLNASKMKLENALAAEERLNKLNSISKANSANHLWLKVLNSSSYLEKGTYLKMNCLGMLETPSPILRNGKDGIIYFGYYPEVLTDDKKNVDFIIPLASNKNGNTVIVEKNDQANMYYIFNI
jgi:hypothetical protein